MSRFTSAAGLACLLLLAHPAAAQPKAGAVDDAAELFDKGNALYHQSRWAEAEVQFQKAWDLRKSFDLAANLGDCELQIGQNREAAEHLAYAVREFPLSGKAALRDRLTQRFAQARTLVGTLKVRVSVQGAAVSVDGRPVGLAPLPDEVFVDPGVRTVEARLPGYEPAQRTVTLEKGGSADVTLALTAPRRSAVPGIVLGSAAGVALVVGTALLVEGVVQRSNAKNLSEAIQGAHQGCIANATNFDTRCAQLNDTALSAGTFHNAGVGVLIGAGALAAGTAAYFLWPAATPSRTSGLRVVPAVSSESAGVLVSGSF